ncbi:Fms-interacting protein-domain-containing protein [Russula ochroleuca]|jgi:THO complex subunit 5|uniref:Fms-interacting protein-domain-containing protein n=1 Tax=Russula ochroleuca TaxID=152965 RepID=A0A9P5N2Y1_9AGAM|nr:Fms-interacting protein-domain-containing protein [Russula ochroleuca]
MTADYSEEVIHALRQLATDNNPAAASPNDDPASVHIRAGALFARLKALNRDANAAARAHKQITADARHDMDQTHLRLQNLLYEKRHLEREIEKCRQFASVYQDIQMYSVEQFIELSPPEAHSEDALSDEHQLMLNRLGFELVERQRLDRRVKELAQEKEELLKTSKSQAATTENVKVQIETLLKTASEIGKKVEELIPAATSTPQDTPVPG